MVPIILLAMIAVLLALRLYTVLGKRTGHEQPLAPIEERSMAAAAPLVDDGRVLAAPVADSVFVPGAASGIRAIVSADPSFDVGRFVEGAKAAYRMILEAYWAADISTLDGLTSDEVRHAFAASIADRTTAGHVLDNRLVTIEQAVISSAQLNGRVASVTVRFEADIATVTRDAEGSVVAGSLTDAVPTVDGWTFTRTVRSDDPNWILTDTDEST